jgi:hypothetical protein
MLWEPIVKSPPKPDDRKNPGSIGLLLSRVSTLAKPE